MQIDPETGATVYVPSEATVTINGDITSGHVETYGSYSYPAGNGIETTGNSTVTVAGDIESADSGVVVKDNAVVVVDGSITSEEGSGIYNSKNGHYDYEKDEWVSDDTAASVIVGGDIEADDYGVSVTGGTSVTVDGSITSGNNGVVISSDFSTDSETDQNVYNASEAIVTVNGDINAGHVETTTYSDGSSYTYSVGSGIVATGDSEVTVEGDVNSVRNGIDIKDNVDVVVNGSITTEEGSGIVNSKSGYYDYEIQSYVNQDTAAVVGVGGDITAGGDGISVTGKTEIIVDGSVTSNGTGVVTNESADVQIGGNINAGTTGVSASGESEVKVDGTVTTKTGTGVNVSGDADVLVDGAVTAGGSGVVVTSDYKTNSETGELVYDPSEATVTIGGDLTAGREVTETYSDGSTYSYFTGQGITATGNSEVNVDGNVKSMKTGLEITDNATVVIDGSLTSEKGSGVINSESSYYDYKEGKTVYNDTAADITINGDISAAGDGVRVTDKTTIEITGGVTAGGNRVSAT